MGLPKRSTGRSWKRRGTSSCRVMSMTTLSKANTTAQYYARRYPGVIMPRLDKFLIHTTETEGWPGYGGGASAPNATYHPRLRQIRQHFPNEMSARALRNPTSTAVSENRDNVFQLEMVCYSDYKLAKSVGGLWVGDLTDAHFTDLAQMIIELGRHGLPRTSSVKWREGQKTYVSGVRLSGPAYDAYKGILGHVHASGNTHWDPGGFRWSRLASKLTAPPKPPTPQPRKEVPLMYVTKFGSTQYRLITGDRIVSISKDAYDTFVRAGLPHEALDNKDIESLQAQLKYEGS